MKGYVSSDETSKIDITYTRLQKLISSYETNTEQIGKLIYTDYFLPFQLSGIVLLVAMIGAILLTFRRRDNVKRQDILKQSSREREDSIVLVDVESNKGVKVND